MASGLQSLLERTYTAIVFITEFFFTCFLSKLSSCLLVFFIGGAGTDALFTC